MEIPYQGKQIDMGPWERLTMVEAVKKYSGVDFNDWKTDEAPSPLPRSAMCELPARTAYAGKPWPSSSTRLSRSKLIQPTFIYDYPVEISPLAKRKPTIPPSPSALSISSRHRVRQRLHRAERPHRPAERFKRQVAERKGDDEARSITTTSTLWSTACPPRAAWASASTASSCC